MDLHGKVLGNLIMDVCQVVMAGPRQPVIHNSPHDPESCFYVLVGICVLQFELLKQKN